ncbi:hypothetical protein T4D_2707 [Trichinella pseudospiralis]|uniref:Uncharacterized protein n=1 Tax=Trichinella pseudospiralis TaxID=6337 RepID=A0A0V1FT77_TRIPS|nr:hypothetical protein T4D_2707 [Trichinella pseudospiralis]
MDHHIISVSSLNLLAKISHAHLHQATPTGLAAKLMLYLISFGCFASGTLNRLSACGLIAVIGFSDLSLFLLIVVCVCDGTSNAHNILLAMSVQKIVAPF